MRWTAWASLPQRSHIGICLEPHDQSLQVARRHGFLGENQKRIVCDQRNGCKIVDHVIGKRVNRPIDHVRGRRDAEGQRVAVRLGTGDPTNAKISIRAGHVFNNDGLAKGTAHVLGDDACNHVRWSARARRHDDGNRPSRIGLRPYHPRGCREGGGTHCELKSSAFGRFAQRDPPITTVLV
jgi:hypothetical protein